MQVGRHRPPPDTSFLEVFRSALEPGRVGLPELLDEISGLRGRFLEAFLFHGLPAIDEGPELLRVRRLDASRLRLRCEPLQDRQEMLVAAAEESQLRDLQPLCEFLLTAAVEPREDGLDGLVLRLGAGAEPLRRLLPGREPAEGPLGRAEVRGPMRDRLRRNIHRHHRL